MDADTMVSTSTTRKKEEVYSLGPTVKNTMENGRTASNTDQAPTPKSTEKLEKENGSMESDRCDAINKAMKP